MNAAIISIGTELTRGELVNSNAQWLAEEFIKLGFEVIEHTALADDEERIVAALRRVAAQAGVIVVTGGLGPTSDDLTAQAAARAAGVELARNQAAAEAIEARFKRSGRHMPRSNLKQADLPLGAELLPNAVGTAPGFAMQMEGARLFFLPGVPSEMKHLFNTEVAGRIADLGERNSCQIHLRSFGLTESKIADLLADLEADLGADRDCGARTTIGYRVCFPEIEIKVLTQAVEARRAEKEAGRVADRICELLGDAVFGGKEDSYPGFVGSILKKNRLKLAIAESCTGGLVGKLITDVPGSSEYFLMDVVAYSNASKSALLGVSQELLAERGAVSGEVAEAMAEGVMQVSGADIAVGITGIAGPDGGSEDRPVGTVWFALATRWDPPLARRRLIPGDRERVRMLSAYFALEMVVEAVRAKTERYYR